MASGTGFFSVKTPPTFTKGRDDYTKWKTKFELWQTITDVDVKKQAGLLILRLDELTQDALLGLMTTEEIKDDDGAKKVIGHLDKLFLKDKTLTAYEKYELFESLKREESVSISEHIMEFEKRWNQTKATGTSLSDNVLAYRLLKSVNLPSTKEELIKATLDTLTFETVKTKLNQTFCGNVDIANYFRVSLNED
jgi:hypothetical protein